MKTDVETGILQPQEIEKCQQLPEVGRDREWILY